MSKKASDATMVARARPTADNHRAAMEAHREASLEASSLTVAGHHDRMAEIHRKKARELTIQSARAAVEHHTKMAQMHDKKSK